MSNTKHFADLMKVCSILPALVIMPAMAEIVEETGTIDAPVQYISNTGDRAGNIGLIRVRNLTEGSYIYDTEKNIMTVASDTNRIKAQDLFVSIQSSNDNDIVPVINVVGDRYTTLDLVSDTAGIYNLVSRFAEMNIGTAENPLGKVLLQQNVPATEMQTAIYVTGGNGHAHAAAQALNIYADEVSIASKYEAITGSEGNLTLVANDKLDIVGAINAYNKDADSGRAGMIFNINRNDGNTAKTTIVGDITAAKAAEVNIGLKGKGSYIIGDITASASSELPGGKVDLDFGIDGAVIGNVTAVDGGNIIVSGDSEVKMDGRVFVSNNAVFQGQNLAFDGNKGTESGGAIHVAANGTLKLDGATFQDNQADGAFGGAIWNKGDVNVKNATFAGNTAMSGGALSISTSPTGGTYIEDGTFTANHAEDGGAISAFNKIEIVNSTFDGNTAMYSKDENGEYTVKIPTNNDPIGGGALALGARSDTDIASISGTTFRNNKSGYNGGAIGTRLAQNTSNGAFNSNLAKLDIAATFENNFAENNGGAIYNTFYNDNESGNGRGVTVAGIFDGNQAGHHGGAIYNDGRHDTHGRGGVMTINGAEFENNFASEGGAIYNTGTLTINGGEFENNYIVGGHGDGGAIWSNGTLKISGTDFSENYATANAEGDYGYGGAIFARGDLVDISGAEDEYAEFSENHALTGGAVYVSKHALTTNIKNVEFENNWASDIGALGIFGKNATLTNLLFENNYTTGEFENFNDGAGALFFGAEAQAVLDNGVFISNNSAGVGGAIATRSPDKGNNSAAKLDIKNSTFRENKAATKGGAIYTAFYNSQEVVDHAYVTDTKFFANEANEGGAIYNEGLGDRGENYATIRLNNVTFGGNGASSQGGAIYNGTGGTVVLSGINAFIDNYAGKYRGLNDIHNMGTLNIAGGETTFGGGVTGTGTLTLAQGAKLNIGTTTIRQDAIDIQGTVTLSVLDNQRGNGYGRFIGDVTVGDNASFEINVGATGTYNILNGALVDKDQISVGKIYEIADVTSGGVTIVTKGVESIAAETGLSEQASGVVSGLANSGNVQLHQVSLMVQQALNDGNVALVERETSKLNPTDKPVAQAAAASVQNQVLSLASGRMSAPMPSVGRSGGDVRSQENGFWIQGLFNKSKLADQFHGYTRGMALGADTLIDNKYTIGGGLAINSSDVHAGARHTDIDSKTLFVYGQYMPNQWFVNGTLTYNMSEYTEATTVLGVPVSNSYDVDAYGAQMMTGYAFGSGITTDLGVRYLHVAQDGYNNGLHEVQAMDTDFLTGIAGVKYAFAIQSGDNLRFSPELHAAVTYDMLSDDAVSTVMMPNGASYQVGGERLSRLGGEFGIGLNMNWRGTELSLMYELDLHEDYTSQTGMIKLRGQF